MSVTKRRLSLVFLLLLLISGLGAWRFLGSNTAFNEDTKTLLIPTGSSLNQVMDSIIGNQLLKNPGSFQWAANRIDYGKAIKPGRYVIERGTSILQLLRTLKNGRQTPVRLVINKIRTRADFAAKVGSQFEGGAAEFWALLSNNDSLARYQLDTNTAITAIIPNTYSILWNTSAGKVFKKLYNEQEKFWTPERLQQAEALHLSKQQVYTLASIVEEETSKEQDKGKIASVYLNRMNQGMRLGADPTVIFALNDFTIRRVLKGHLQFNSPYNTYLHDGLPPGPICTPSIKTIDAVLHAPSTNYLYFVAQPNLTGYSNFAATYPEHLVYAKQYQQWINEYLKNKAANP